MAHCCSLHSVFQDSPVFLSVCPLPSPALHGVLSHSSSPRSDSRSAVPSPRGLGGWRSPGRATVEHSPARARPCLSPGCAEAASGGGAQRPVPRKRRALLLGTRRDSAAAPGAVGRPGAALRVPLPLSKSLTLAHLRGRGRREAKETLPPERQCPHNVCLFHKGDLLLVPVYVFI